MLPAAVKSAMRQQLRPDPPTHNSRFATPALVASHIDPRTIATPALDLIDQHLVDLLDTSDGRLIISMPPQEGKSTRCSRDLPVWALQHDPNLRIVTASYGQGLANRNGRAVRNAIAAHPDLGIRIAHDHGAASEWSVSGHDGGVLSVGRGAGVTGRPADLIIIDDPLKDRTEADSKVIRDTCWDWWTDALSARLAPGAPVLLILTRWHEDDLAGRLTKLDVDAGWKTLNIPAQCEDAASDPLGREVGEYMISARRNRNGDPRTTQQWEQRKATAGARTWAALYQGRPAPAEGNMVRRTWWRHYDLPPWVEAEDGTRRALGMDQVIISADLAFKGESTSDFVSIGVWGTRGPDAYLLDRVHGRFDFPETVRRLEGVAARWPEATLKIIEDKANGPAVIATLRQRMSGLVAEIPQGSKEARVAAVSPLIEAGNVWLPSARIAPWVEGYVTEWASFPNAANDDDVDMGTQALNRLLLQPLLTGADRVVTPEWYDEDHSIINY